MNTKAFILTAIAAGAVCGCAPKTQVRSIVVYYSATGTTETVAELFRDKTGSDMVEILALKPYDTAYDALIEQYQKEMQAGVTREIQSLDVNFDDYDVIYLGSPVWFGQCCGPVETFLKSYNLKGKTIVPFFTFGSGGNTAVDMVEKYQPEAEIPAWYGIRAARIEKAAAEIDTFLVGLGVMEGEVVQLPEYSPERELSEAEKAIFEQACGSYPMPLGNPVAVSSRETSDADEYIFKTLSPDGERTARIYVTRPKDGGAAEFTQVVR